MMRTILMCVLLCTTSSAQVNVNVPLSYYLPSEGPYDTRVPTPEQFFGFQVGSWHLQPEQIHAYMRALAAASPRVTILPMGRSYEEKEMMLAVFIAPERRSELETIRLEHLALSDPASSSKVDLSRMPVVVWLGYSVHGNEASGSNASVLVAYALAASGSAEVKSILENSVVLFNPSINPDGLNRFATWVNANRGMQIDPMSLSREHNEPWPGGRTNHYWFDLNRDWMPLQHPESRARLERYYEWRPNLLTDHHEMGTRSTFFFQPGIPTRNNPLVPSTVGELTASIAAYHAAGLDSIGALYYTEESFDDFYVGKGSSYPDITGGIGILFEQASSRGHAQENGVDVLTFPYAIRNHVTASFTSLRAAVAHRERLLEHQRSMASSAMTLAQRSPFDAYVFGSADDATRTRALASILARHNISVYELKKRVDGGGHSFLPGSAFVVPVRQASYRLLTSLFERRTSFEDSLFYDVSAWALPLAFGVPFLERKGSTDEIVGAGFVDDAPGGGVTSLAEPGYAYVFPWTDYFAPRAVRRLQTSGVNVRMAFRPFSAMTASGAKSFDRGTVIVPVGAQPITGPALRSLMLTVMREDAVRMESVVSGLTPGGIDLGSPNVFPLEKPRIAIAAGQGVSPASAGEVWHLLDQRFGHTVTMLDPQHIGGPALDRFNVLILPSGNYQSTDSVQHARLRDWVQRGNTLIALEQAAMWAVRTKLASTALTKPLTDGPDSTAVVVYEDEEKFRGARNTPGAIVSATADLTHPLLFGYTSPDIHLFKSSAISFLTSGRKALTPISYGRSPLVSGYLHVRTSTNIAGAAAVAVSSAGNGRVILIADNPAFRAYWYGTARLLLNAVWLSRNVFVAGGLGGQEEL